MTLPGTYERCMSGHYYAVVRGDEECSVCKQLEAAKLREAELASALEIARTALKAYAPTDKWHENTASIALERSRNPSAAHAERKK